MIRAVGYPGRSRALALCVLIGGSTAAQSHWIVDANNGPGTQFVQVSSALASPQVLEGDVLLVRAGTYEQFATSKGVAILGQGAVTFAPTGATAAAATVEVLGLSAGRRFVLANATIDHDCTNSRSGVWLHDNVGPVYFENVDTRGVGSPTWLFPFCTSVDISNCALVTWNRGSIAGAGGINAFQTSIHFTRVAAQGLRGTDLSIRTIPSTPGLTMQRTTAFLAACDLRGGSGSGAAGPSSGLYSVCYSCTNALVLAGDTGNVVAAGAGGTVPTPGIRLDATTLTYDPRIGIVGSNGGPPIAGSGTATPMPVAYVAGAGAPLGGTMQVSMTSQPGNGAFLALGIPTSRLPTPFGPLFLDPATMVPLFVGFQGSSGITTLALGVPAVGALRGLALALQAADAAGAVMRFTNPVVVLVH